MQTEFPISVRSRLRPSISPVRRSGLLFLLAVSVSLGALPCLPSRADQTAPDPKPADGQITFVAYNLWNYLAMGRRIDGEYTENAPKPEEQIDALIRAIASTAPDVLGVCELGDDTFLADFQARLKAAGVDLPHTEMVIAVNNQQRNLALLSRFPIVARNSKDDLSYRINNTVLPFQRGILDVTIAPSENYRLRLIGLHLKSKRETREADQALMRRNEAQLAREHIDAILEDAPGTNLLVYGDLNETRNEPPIRSLQGRFGSKTYLTDIQLKDRYGFRWTHYWGWADIYARLDFALFSDGLSAEVDRDRSFLLHPPDWDLASDHRALVVRLVPEDR